MEHLISKLPDIYNANINSMTIANTENISSIKIENIEPGEDVYNGCYLAISFKDEEDNLIEGINFAYIEVEK